MITPSELILLTELYKFPFTVPCKMTEDRAENVYPARSHDCKLYETEFAEDPELSQPDVERREKNLKTNLTSMPIFEFSTS